MGGGFSLVACLQIIAFSLRFFCVQEVVSMLEDNSYSEAADIFTEPLSMMN